MSFRGQRILFNNCLNINKRRFLYKNSLITYNRNLRTHLNNIINKWNIFKVLKLKYNLISNLLMKLNHKNKN